MAKGFAKPLCASQRRFPVNDELQAANHELISKQKLTLIMHSNVSPAQRFKIDDLVEIFMQKLNMDLGLLHDNCYLLALRLVL